MPEEASLLTGADAPTTPAPDGAQTNTPDKGGGTPEGKTADAQAIKAEYEAKLQEAITQRQAAKAAVRELEERMKSLEDRAGKAPDPETYSAYQEWKAQQEAAEKNKAIKAGDVEAIEKRAQEPLRLQINAKDQRIASLETQLTSLLRDSALRNAAEEAGAYSPAQVVGLLRHRVKMQDANGQYVPQFVDDDGQPLFDANGNRVADPKTFVTTFLSRPENANLVRAHAAPGTGAKPSGGKPSQAAGKVKSLDEFSALDEEGRKKALSAMSIEEQRALFGTKTGAGAFGSLLS